MVGIVMKSGEPITKLNANSSIDRTKTIRKAADRPGLRTGRKAVRATLSGEAPRSRAARMTSSRTCPKETDRMRTAKGMKRMTWPKRIAE